jgi:hypothetical protein
VKDMAEDVGSVVDATIMQVECSHSMYAHYGRYVRHAANGYKWINMPQVMVPNEGVMCRDRW